MGFGILKFLWNEKVFYNVSASLTIEIMDRFFHFPIKWMKDYLKCFPRDFFTKSSIADGIVPKIEVGIRFSIECNIFIIYKKYTEKSR